MNMDIKKDWSNEEQIEACKMPESIDEEVAKKLIENAQSIVADELFPMIFMNQEVADASDFDAAIIPRLPDDIPLEALITNKPDGNEIAKMCENNLNNYISEGYSVPTPNGDIIFASHASVSYNGDDDTGTMSFSVSYTLREDEGVCTFQSSVKRPDERS